MERHQNLKFPFARGSMKPLPVKVCVCVHMNVLTYMGLHAFVNNSVSCNQKYPDFHIQKIINYTPEGERERDRDFKMK